MIVVITEKAALDLERIGDMIAQDNPDRAVTFLRELRFSCEGLGDFPKAYPLIPRYEDSGIRRRVHGNYLIFYRIGLGASRFCTFCTAPWITRLCSFRRASALTASADP